MPEAFPARPLYLVDASLYVFRAWHSMPDTFEDAEGHPANAVAWLANTLGALGIALEAGEVILSGSLAAMVPVKAGDNLRVSIGGIGSCSVRFV